MMNRSRKDEMMVVAAKSSKEQVKSSFDCVLCISNVSTTLLVNRAGFDCFSSHTIAYRFATDAELAAHIAVEHLTYVPFQCERCPMLRFPTVAILRQHHRFIHYIDEFDFVFQVSNALDEKRKQLKILVNKGRGATATALLHHNKPISASVPCTIDEVKPAPLIIPLLKSPEYCQEDYDDQDVHKEEIVFDEEEKSIANSDTIEAIDTSETKSETENDEPTSIAADANTSNKNRSPRRPVRRNVGARNSDRSNSDLSQLAAANDLIVTSETPLSHKVYVSRIPMHITQADLRLSFQQFGSCDVSLPHNRASPYPCTCRASITMRACVCRHSIDRCSSMHKGYGFVMFSDMDDERKMLAASRSVGRDYVVDLQLNSARLSQSSNNVGGFGRSALPVNSCYSVAVVPWPLAHSNYSPTTIPAHCLQPPNRRNLIVQIKNLQFHIRAKAIYDDMSRYFHSIILVTLDTDNYDYPKGYFKLLIRLIQEALNSFARQHLQ